MERIKLDNISKQFTVGAKNKSALDSAIGLLRRQGKRKLWALKDVSLNANAGENIGIIGKNGGGKSTLLRTVVGIYAADSGSVHTKGKIVYLDGLAPGLKSKLTMRENIYLTGSLLGLSQKDIKNKFNTIVEFSGLEEFVDTKIAQFSSGMVARFSFSATIHFVKHHEPDIILLDEVFDAPADFEFRKKAVRKTEELIKGGATVLLASHRLNLIRKYCHRAIWLNKGEIIKQGKTVEVCDAYEKS